MNIPLYAVALAVFAILFLWFSVFLLVTLWVTLMAMTIVLGGQVILQRRAPPGPYDAHASDPDWAEARAKSSRHQRVDSALDVGFIAGTWAIFYWLGRNSVQLIGPGLTSPSAGPGAVPEVEVYGLLGLVVALIVALGLLYAQYSSRTGARQAYKFRDRNVEPVLPGEIVECGFDSAFEYVTASKPPAPWTSEKREGDLQYVTLLGKVGLDHEGDLQHVTLLGKAGFLPRRFVLCRKHLNYILPLDSSSPVFARR